MVRKTKDVLRPQRAVLTRWMTFVQSPFMTRSHLVVGAIGAVLFLFTSCGGGGGGGRGSIALEARSNALGPGGTVPSYEFNGAAAKISFYTDDLDRVRLALLTSKVSSAQTAVRFDPVTRLPIRVDDLTDGTFTTIENTGSRIEFLSFAPNGAYESAFAVVQDGAGFGRTAILGRPGFQGQVSGQLAVPAIAQTGSYAVVAKVTSAGGTVVPIPANVQQACNVLAQVGGGTDDTLLRAFLGLAVAGDVRPQDAAAYGAAGICAILGGLGGAGPADFLANRFTVAGQLAQEALDLALFALARSDAVALAAFWTNLATNIANGAPFTSAELNALKAALSPQTLADTTPAPTPTAAVGTPPVVQVDVEGQCIWQDGTVYVLIGTIAADGRLDCVGNRVTNPTPTDIVTLLGQLGGTSVGNGVCTRNGQTGTLTGSTQPFGECNAQTSSGGQGTFTFAQFIGFGQGAVTFSYQAFTIPDQFIVRTNVGERFNTGGLVSGSQTVSIPINNEPLVFVSVAAPQSGTAWNFSLGCLQ
jgi:hypothetical protein